MLHPLRSRYAMTFIERFAESVDEKVIALYDSADVNLKTQLASFCAMILDELMLDEIARFKHPAFSVE
jgi:hypothetical protein